MSDAVEDTITPEDRSIQNRITEYFNKQIRATNDLWKQIGIQQERNHWVLHYKSFDMNLLESKYYKKLKKFLGKERENE